MLGSPLIAFARLATGREILVTADPEWTFIRDCGMVPAGSTFAVAPTSELSCCPPTVYVLVAVSGYRTPAPESAGGVTAQPVVTVWARRRPKSNVAGVVAVGGPASPAPASAEGDAGRPGCRRCW